jgi:hypothetical protein
LTTMITSFPLDELTTYEQAQCVRQTTFTVYRFCIMNLSIKNFTLKRSTTLWIADHRCHDRK